MIDRPFRVRTFISLLLLASLASLFSTACSSNESKAKKLIEEYLKGQGAANITVDFFYTNPAFPDKAYTSATVTYSFGSGEGKPQREFLGFILTRAGEGWRIERTSGYAKEKTKADTYLAGGK